MTFKKINRIITVIFATIVIGFAVSNHYFAAYCVASGLVGWMWPSNWKDEGGL